MCVPHIPRGTTRRPAAAKNRCLGSEMVSHFRGRMCDKQRWHKMQVSKIDWVSHIRRRVPHSKNASGCHWAARNPATSRDRRWEQTAGFCGALFPLAGGSPPRVAHSPAVALSRWLSHIRACLSHIRSVSKRRLLRWRSAVCVPHIPRGTARRPAAVRNAF